MFGMMRSVPMLAILCLLALAAPVMGQDLGGGGGGDSNFNLQNDLIGPAILSIAFTVIGLILFGICLLIVVKVAPFSVRKEIEEDQNTALGIIIGSMILGIAIILAAALLG